MSQPPAANAPLKRASAIDIEVVRNELEAIVDEMKITTRKTGRSPLVKVGDFAATLCDAEGHGIGIGHTVLTHAALYAIARKARLVGGDTLAEGDVFVTNDPYGGGSHMPDLAVVQPLIWRGDLVGFATIYSHHTDMGGRVPGSQSGACRESFEEGLRVPMIRLYERGVRQDDVFALMLANVRGGEEFVGDIEAKITGCRRAAVQLAKLLDRHGREAFEECRRYLNSRSETHLRAAIGAIPDGRYEADVPLDDDGFGLWNDPQGLHIAVDVAGEHMTLDFAGTAPQAAGAVNMPIENTRGMILSALKDVLAPEVQINEGFCRPVTILVPEGSVLNPIFPAATGGRAPTLFMLEDLLFRVLAKALPGKVPVPREWWDVVHYSGRRPDGRGFAIMDLFAGGWGARPDKDGPDGVSSSPSTSLPVELLEREYPMMIEEFTLVTGTGGPGRYRGSQAVQRTYRFLAPGRAMVRTNRRFPTQGLDGGSAGVASTNYFSHGGETSELPQRAFHHLDVAQGDRLVHRIGGCGGYGPPPQRDRDAVARDLAEQRITPDQAREVYGLADLKAPSSGAAVHENA